MNLETLLQPFQRFGVHLGLERIQTLLHRLGDPQHRVPTLHVAGTNGKGSVCAYLSSILAEGGYRVGRYISPHLVDWSERININDVPISEADFRDVLREVIVAIPADEPSPTQFEVITAVAWLYFARQEVDVAVVEVGLGGRLDATNVIDRPLVSVITSLSLEHWQRLGPTLADIAREKAGILKPGRPAIVGPLPPEARTVVADRLAELGCPVTWVKPAELVHFHPFKPIASDNGLEYELPLPGRVQLLNSAIAIAAVDALRNQGWAVANPAVIDGIAKTRWPGRLQWVARGDRQFLIDGAHNPAAAAELRRYVDDLEQFEIAVPPIHWVMGMLSTKDHADIFRALLRPGDHLDLVPVPDHSSAVPERLAALARSACPDLGSCQTHADPIAGLEEVLASSEGLVVLCGSLYLAGKILKEFKLRSATDNLAWGR
ncbi:MAG: bifunctional folylpolyglutamate synthase/dihydrofolate synthase [Limnospira sp.]